MSSSKKMSMFLFASMVFIVLAYTGPVYGRAGHQGSPDAWMENYTLILTGAKTITEAYRAADAIERAGGQVYVILPNQVMLGRVPSEAVNRLVGKWKIRGIYQKPVGPSAQEGLDASSANAIAFFNKVASGTWKGHKTKVRAMLAADEFPPEMLPDAFQAPAVSHSDYLENLKANGVTEEMLKADGITLNQPTFDTVAPSPGNSDYMLGRVAFSAMFVESNGGVDPNLYTWTAANRTLIQNEILAGLSWWANTAKSTTYKTPLTFVCSFYYSIKTRTGYEPILHSSSDDYLWINEIMANFGYASGDKFARCTAFNTARRIARKTNWAVVSFIGYNPSPAATTFTNGYFAYAYVGAYSQLLFRNDGWSTSSYDVVNAHETGHLFGGLDEYYTAGYGGCTSCDASRNGVLNGNCEFCNANAQPCMMRSNTMALCGYTPGHLGWQSIRSLKVATYLTTGKFKDFFAPGQPIQYKVSYCIAGPRVGSTAHTVRVRFRADFYGGTVDAPSTVFDDTGWATAGTVSPPTSSGVTCYNTSWNRTVPAGAAFGPANVTVQLSVEKYGKGSVTDKAKFFVAPGANPSTISPLPASVVQQAAPALNEGPFTAPASAP